MVAQFITPVAAPTVTDCCMIHTLAAPPFVKIWTHSQGWADLADNNYLKPRRTPRYFCRCRSCETMESIFIARQPIYNRDLGVYAYELLFRSAEANHANVVDGDQATSDVLLNTMIDIGLDNIVGRRPAFVNMTRGFLTGALPLPLMKDRVVLEVLEDLTPDDELITGLKALAAAGYLIALDDFEYRPEFKPLLEIAHIVKLDILALGPEALSAHVKLLRAYPLKLLAEKVETQDELAHCQALGFDYFQGYFFCQPEIVTGRRPNSNQLVVMELLAKLQDRSVEVDELERLIAQDASLAYRLLRYINSAYFELHAEVASIKHALTLLGAAAIRQWASLILMARLANEKPAELLVTGMVRARMCQLLGNTDPEIGDDQYFTVGLISILDALIDMPLSEVLAALPLAAESKLALSNHSGLLGETLRNVLDYEQGRWDRLDNADGAKLQNAYVSALQWHRGSQQTLHS